MTGAAPQSIVTLDLEGVLVPEIWIAVAEATGVDELLRTTRDEPDYDVLMAGRIAACRDHDLTMATITDVIAGLTPLPGAPEFLDELRARTQVVLLSDTFEQFGRPLMAQLGWPTLFCHRLLVSEASELLDYRLRMPDQKAGAVRAFRNLNFRVAAAGDSYNDITMLAEADAGFLFRSPSTIRAEFPHFEATDDYDRLLELLLAATSCVG